MELLDNWIEQIPTDGDPSEITKAEILSTGHCYLSAYFSEQCEDLHGRTLQTLFVHPWPDKTPGPLSVYPSRIQTGLEWLFVLLDPLTKFAYLQRVNETYPKSQAPLHKIRASLLRDQAGGYRAFRQFQGDLQSFWKTHAGPLNLGRDWLENEKLAEGAFFALIQSDPQDLTGKLALGFMAEKLSTFCGDSQLCGQKLDVFSRFLQDFCKNLQNEYAEAFSSIGDHAGQSKKRKGHEAHPEYYEAIRAFIAGRGRKKESVFNFLKRNHRRGNPLEIRIESGAIVYIFYESSTDEGRVYDESVCYSLKHPRNIKNKDIFWFSPRTFRGHAEPRFQKK